MTPSEEAYKQCEATPEEIAEAQALNPDLKPEQIAEIIAQMKGQALRLPDNYWPDCNPLVK